MGDAVEDVFGGGGVEGGEDVGTHGADVGVGVFDELALDSWGPAVHGVVEVFVVGGVVFVHGAGGLSVVSVCAGSAAAEEDEGCVFGEVFDELGEVDGEVSFGGSGVGLEGDVGFWDGFDPFVFFVGEVEFGLFVWDGGEVYEVL